MKRNICVRSMGLGAVIMLIGLAVGAIVSPPLIAQRDDVFGDIQCTGLTVVDKQGNVGVALDTDNANGSVWLFGKDGGAAAMNINADGGSVVVYNNQGKPCALVNVNADGGSVSVSNNQGKPHASMGGHEDGGGVAVYNNQGTPCASMDAHEDGGSVGVSNNQGKPRAAMGINEFGNGAVSTWDKNGYRQ